jgi:hypothetical protein
MNTPAATADPADEARPVSFESLESSHDYVCRLGQAVDDAICQIEADIRLATANGATRRVEALRLAAYKLGLLRGHFVASRRLLNDLRTLRRLLLQERTADQERRAST